MAIGDGRQDTVMQTDHEVTRARFLELLEAHRVFERVVSGAGWNAFGFIAAEADLQRR